MSRKHNTKHQSRGTSNYPDRLAARGETNASVRQPWFDKDGRRVGSADRAGR
jgi:hypothetical protein